MTQPRRAAIYARISKDTLGQQLGVQRQEAECRELVERRGWDHRQNFVRILCVWLWTALSVHAIW